MPVWLILCALGYVLDRHKFSHRWAGGSSLFQRQVRAVTASPNWCDVQVGPAVSILPIFNFNENHTPSHEIGDIDSPYAEYKP